jgi:EAL domain-containing protein (putative c-di-GMP-specific phosphodiesterase class I)
MAKPENALKVLTNFTMMGIKLAIDDFGTGFSSLAYLKKLPVDELKIDKSFVMDLPHDENDLIIVRSTVELAHNLAIDVVAEGIETEAAYGLLKSMKCNSAQGFYISKPLDAQALESFLNIREQA